MSPPASCKHEFEEESTIQGGDAVLLGVDIGGTFTDCVMVDDTGTMRVVKVPTTPDGYSGVFDALSDGQVDGRDIASFVHGTTLGTNALIERRLPRTALITTKGWRGVLTQVARGAKEDVWDLHDGTPKPAFVPQRDRFEVDERTLADGRIRRALNEDEARRVVRMIKRRGITTIAVCFIHAYANSTNEQRMKELVLEEYPESVVTTSHETSRRISEYERFVTTVLNVSLIPLMHDYIGHLEKGLSVRGYGSDVLIAQSGGGLIGSEATRLVPVRTANSGPAMGALAAREVGRGAGRESVIGLDIGGTSTDVSVVLDGKLRMTDTWHVEWGHPILFPAVDVIAVGAGGGSVAWFDSGGKLRNGPLSMGANPGPACYLRGGGEPTNTDAHLVIGSLHQDTLLGGQVALDQRAAEQVIADNIASRLGTDLVHAADAILAVAEANMANAIRLATMRRGLDPRDFALVAFGGAGPLHGVRVARELHIPEVIVPPSPGLTSAMGCLIAEIRHDVGASLFFADTYQADPSELEVLFVDFERRLQELLIREGVDPRRRLVERSVDMCYAGQWRVIQVPVTGGMTRQALHECVEQFHVLHAREFSFSLEGRPVEIHGIAASGIGLRDKPDLKPMNATGPVADALLGRRNIFWREDDSWLETPVYARDRLRPEAVIEGPAILEQMDSTTVIPRGARAEANRSLALRISFGSPGQ